MPERHAGNGFRNPRLVAAAYTDAAEALARISAPEVHPMVATWRAWLAAHPLAGQQLAKAMQRGAEEYDRTFNALFAEAQAGAERPDLIPATMH